MPQPGSWQMPSFEELCEQMIAQAEKVLPNASQRLQLAQEMFRRATSGVPMPMLQLRLLQQVARLDPFSVRYRLELVKSLQAQEMVDEAIVECRQALEFWPTAVPLQLLLGNLLLDTGEIDKARECLNKIVLTDNATGQNELMAQVAFARLECALRLAKSKEDWQKALKVLREIEIMDNTAGLFCEKCLKIYIECDEEALRDEVVALAQQKAGAHPAYQLLQRIASFDPHACLNSVSHISQVTAIKHDGLEGLLTAHLLARRVPLPNTDEGRLKHLAGWQTLIERQPQWFGLQDAYISVIDEWAAQAYQKKNFTLGATLWREAERVAPAQPTVLQNLAITYTRLQDEKYYEWYWEKFTHIWTLYGEMLPEARTYEKTLLQKHQAFIEGAQAKLKQVPDTELAELGIVWVKEAISYCALRQLAFRNVFFRCGLKTEDWADEKERQKLLAEGQSCMERWLKQIATWQNLGAQSELAQWRIQRLTDAVKQVQQVGQESYRYHDEEKDAFEQYREYLLTYFSRLCFKIADTLIDKLDFTDKTARTQYAEIARGLLSFPHGLLEPSVRKAVKGFPKNTTLYELVRNYAIGPYYKRAKQAMENDTFAQAVGYLEDLLTIIPDFLLGLFYLAICHRNLEHWDEAQQVARRGLAHCVDNDEDTRQIKERLNEFLADFPTIKIAKELRIAREAMQRKRWREALNSLDAALIRSPDHLIALFHKAICHFRLEEWDAAGNIAKRALPLCQAKQEEHKQIAEQLQTLLFQIPLARVAKETRRVQQELKREHWQEALTLSNAIVARVPEHVPARLYQAVCYYRLRNWQQALRVAQQALPLAAAHSEYHTIEEQLQQVITQVNRIAPFEYTRFMTNSTTFDTLNDDLQTMLERFRRQEDHQ